MKRLSVTHAAIAARLRQQVEFEKRIEAAYWEFDARRKGDGEWNGRPQAERDAFKAACRFLMYGEQA